MGLFDGVGEFFGNAWDGICDVASNVGNAVMDAGKAALDGVCTFGKEVGNTVCAWGQNIADGWNNGMARASEGIEQMKAGAGFAGFMNMLGGGLYGITGGGLGAIEAVNDAVVDSSVEVVDSLGNVSLVAKNEENPFVAFFANMARGTISDDRNLQNSIKDAVAAGDPNKANEIMGMQFGKVGTKVLSVGVSVAGYVAAPFTGGASIIPCQVAGSLLDMASDQIDSAMKADDLKTDISRAVDKKVDALMASGQLTAENKEAYEQILTKFYNSDSVLGGGQTGAMSIDYIDQMAAANGMITAANGEEMSPDTLTAVYDEYMKYYQEGIDNGSLTKDQAERLSSIGSLYSVGQMDEQKYLMEMHMIQNEAYDMTREQAAMLSALDTKRDMGEITEEEYNSALFTDPTFSDFVQEDGTLYIPLKGEDPTFLDRMAGKSPESPASYTTAPSPAFDSSKDSSFDMSKLAINISGKAAEKETLTDSVADTSDVQSAKSEKEAADEPSSSFDMSKLKIGLDPDLGPAFSI